MMKKTMLTALTSVLEPVLRKQVYVARAGLIAGLKRRGGFGFVPKRTLTQEHKFLKSLNFRGETVYDVGGHIGLTTMFFAREVGETGSVVTFEPNPENYYAILDHIELNGFTNVRVLQMGLGSKQETLKFMVNASKNQSLSALGTADPNKQKRLLKQGNIKVLHIEVDTMDNQITINNLPKPDFIKVDTEGLEMDVLCGMTQTISAYRPEMLIELHGTNETEIVEFLLSYDYNVYQVEDGIEITHKNIDMIHGHLYVH